MVGRLARFSATSPHQLSVLSLGGLGLIWQHLQEIPLHITHDGFCCWQTKTKSVIGINWDCVPVPRPTQHSNFFFFFTSIHLVIWVRGEVALYPAAFFPPPVCSKDGRDERKPGRAEEARRTPARLWSRARRLHETAVWMMFSAGGKQAFNVKVVERSLRKTELFFIFSATVGAKIFRRLFISLKLLFPLKKWTSGLAMQRTSFTDVIKKKKQLLSWCWASAMNSLHSEKSH